jgi:hypothetical protein
MQFPTKGILNTPNIPFMIKLFIIKKKKNLFRRYLNTHLGNTLLIDNMPYRTRQNPPLNVIFVKSHEHMKEEDNYFMGTFLPHLESLHYNKLSVPTFVEDYIFGAIRSLNENDVEL